MNAKEARQKALAFNTESTNSQYQKIMAIILRESCAGKYEVHYGDVIKSDVKAKLESEGYKVGATLSHRNENMTKIEW